MVTAKDREVQSLESDQKELADQVAGLMAQARPGDAANPPPELLVASGAVAVRGQGLTVSLSDAPSGAQDGGDAKVPAENYLVHQQDIDAVLTALWAGGAEALSVQGHRVVSTTAIRCVGNVILVAGRVYSPPYVIQAVGPQKQMEDQLGASLQVQAFAEAAQTLGLGWSVTAQDNVEIDANPGGTLALRYARMASNDPAEEGELGHD
jgi:uncharacterized protein YlxW (UPF0749 family)